MTSRWFRLKETACALRHRGCSITKIEHKLGIARSTLSGWFRKIQLTKKQERILAKNSKKGLEKARVKAVKWHNAQKKARLLLAKKEAKNVLRKIDTTRKEIIDLTLASLYLGEGFKKTNETAMGNSDPLILKFFVTALRKNYSFPVSKIKCELHLRADQKVKKMKEYWSRKLKIPLSNFTSVSIDKRTQGSTTYQDYKGVCVLRCGSVAIQRKLLYLSKMFYEKVINSLGS